MRTVFFLLALGSSTGAYSQSADVTFYSSQSLIKQLLPVAKNSAFYGFIFDEGQKVAFLNHGQFGTLAFPAGTHHFSAGLDNKPQKTGSNISLELKAGERYFIAMSADVTNILPYYSQHTQFTVVDCQIASEQTSTEKGIPEKHLYGVFKSQAAKSQVSPTCAP